MLRYRLDDLGWLQFEQLCQSVMKARLGLAIESWGGPTDTGRDSYYAGALRIVEGVEPPGPFVFQVKFVDGANAAGAKPGGPLLAAVNAECKRIAHRISNKTWKQISNFVLLTNVALTSFLRSQVAERLRGELGGIGLTLWGAADICDFLDTTPKIRLAFPQILSLRDLDQLLLSVVQKTVLERSRAAVDEARELSHVFFPSRPYRAALDVLKQHAFAVLTGAPEMGKTAIARMIGLAQLSEGWTYFDCYTPDDFFGNLDDSTSQVFVADDAFGTTEYRPELAIPWGHQLPKVLRRLNARRWLIWTSRPAPLHFALQKLHLEGKAARFPQPGEVKVDVSALSGNDKAQILYRHAKAHDLTPDAKQLVRSLCGAIVANKHFTPERIRRFVAERLNDLAARLTDDEIREGVASEIIASEIEQPTRRMAQSFENVDPSHQNFMIALLDCGSASVSETACSEAYYRIFRDDADVPPERIALDLEGHFLRRQEIRALTSPTQRKRQRQMVQAEVQYEWLHPSWRDIAIGFLVDHRERRRRFLTRCSVNGLSLALSVGGGHSGERVSPLLRHQDDWEALEERLRGLAASADPNVLYRVLLAINQAVENATTKEDPDLPRLAALRSVYQYAIYDRSQQRDFVFPQHVVRAFAESFTDFGKDQYAQLLAPTLDKIVHDLHEATRNQNDCELKDSLDAFTTIVEVAGAHAPQLLESLLFPAEFVELMRKGLETLAAYDHQALCDRDTGSLESEQDYVGEMQSLCEWVGERFPELGHATRDTLCHLEWCRERLAEEQEEVRVKKEEEERVAQYWDDEREFRAQRDGTHRPPERNHSVARSAASRLADIAAAQASVTEIFKDL